MHYVALCSFVSVAMMPIQRKINMENITETLRRGYSIAKTKEQFDRVKHWQDKISKKVASCHSMLDECDRLDREFDKVAKRMGLK